MTADDVVADLLAYIDRSPTPYHAVAESARRLEAGGWHPLAEDEAWELAPGARRYVVRGDGSLAAFQCGSVPPAEAGFRVIGAHTDSPNLRLKPLPDDATHGYRRLGCEIYGGVLLHTWLDRDLSLAGRVVFGPPEALRTALVDFERPLLRVPNLAIHLNRDVTKEGLKLDPQQHLVPVVGLEDAPPLKELLATELRASGFAGAAPDTIRSFDLMTYDVQPSCVAGARGEFVLAPRLDNLASCHAAVCRKRIRRGRWTGASA